MLGYYIFSVNKFKKYNYLILWSSVAFDINYLNLYTKKLDYMSFSPLKTPFLSDLMGYVEPYVFYGSH